MQGLDWALVRPQRSGFSMGDHRTVLRSIHPLGVRNRTEPTDGTKFPYVYMFFGAAGWYNTNNNTLAHYFVEYDCRDPE